ncbi:MAG: hypothetical protein PWQ67_2404 [Clostridia bacterium]|nr:hypothetical protein [Clostridia bacterium]MDN5323950.1 hypothetical protein [Clostridia bacterium]
MLGRNYTQRIILDDNYSLSIEDKYKVYFHIALLWIILSASITFIIWWPTHNQEQETQTFIKEVKELASLATAEMHVLTTIEGKDNKILGLNRPFDLPGTKQIYYIVIPAKITAGLDLKEFTKNDIIFDKKNKHVKIILPHATFLNETIEIDKLIIFTTEGIYYPKTTTQESLSLITQEHVKEKLYQQAINSGLINNAEITATKILIKFFQLNGYQVEVYFEDN